MIWAMTSYGFGFSQYQKGMASFARIRAVLETPTSLPDFGDRIMQHFEYMEVRELTYTYPDKKDPALDGLNFTIRKGETLGIVGPIGSGKSTLVQLLARVLPSSPGQVAVNGHSIETYTLESLHKNLILVSQEPTLFSLSIQENIRLAHPEVSIEDLDHWMKSVQMHTEIQSLPFGMNTELGEKGVNLSGGQKQRLSLARGFVMRPDFLILDDTLSAVDTHTEERLILELEKWNQTLVLFSHRLSVLRSCDRILVLNQGRIEHMGTWDETYQHSATFRQLCALQGVQP
jgi:ATP-binding cassette subfamily B protein